ncbi:MAG: S1 RNA-binding domain-containing protein [Clostridiales bacterium]|nr:S1 RNA-binding domain-containing protein [Clostridiales bacterium]
MQVEVGTIVEGKVTGLTNYGAFVELECGSTGMVHISEVANTYVTDIKDHLTMEQEVKVKVISVDDDGKIGLSIKKADDNPEAKEERRSRPPLKKRPAPIVWQGPKKAQADEPQSFEDMMSKFKKVSEEKMTDLKHSNEAKHGGGYSRRGGRR